MTRRLFHNTAAFATVGFLIVAAPASGQNALGDGTALDNNLSVEGTRNVGAPQPDFRLRNLLVTRNVAAGRGFRDAVGYFAADDFRGATGSDDIFRFQSDSALSSLAAIHIARGGQSVNLGQDIGLLEYRRNTMGSTLRNLGEPAGGLRSDVYGDELDAEARLDHSLRDSQSNGQLLLTDNRPESLAYFTTSAGDVIRLSASSLQGLRLTPLAQDASLLGLNSVDHARLLDAALTKGGVVSAGTPFDVDVLRLLNAQREAEPAQPDQPSLNQTAPSTYLDLVREMAARTGGATPDESAQRFDEQMLRTTHWLRGVDPAADGQPFDPMAPIQQPIEATVPGQPALPGVTAPLPNPSQPDLTQPSLTQPGAFSPTSGQTVPALTQNAAAGEPVRREAVRLPPDMTPEMLRHGRVIDTLVPDSGDRFAEIMLDGETRLRAGEYLLAERDFVRASGLHPNHPMAMAGMANAQIGAGILASASVSLRSLFVHRPEMIDATYESGLLPHDQRLAGLIESLQQRLESSRRSSGAALLLAYLGRQTSSTTLIQRGLLLMEEIDPGDPLVPVLKAVWLEAENDGNAEPQPHEQPAEAAGEGDADK